MAFQIFPFMIQSLFFLALLSFPYAPPPEVRQPRPRDVLHNSALLLEYCRVRLAPVWTRGGRGARRFVCLCVCEALPHVT